MYVCMYVCMYVFMYVCMYVCTYVSQFDASVFLGEELCTTLLAHFAQSLAKITEEPAAKLRFKETTWITSSLETTVPQKSRDDLYDDADPDIGAQQPRKDFKKQQKACTSFTKLQGVILNPDQLQ